MLMELRFWMSTLDTIQGLLLVNEAVARELIPMIETKMTQRSRNSFNIDSLQRPYTKFVDGHMAVIVIRSTNNP
jgi:hypothetical protein